MRYDALQQVRMFFTFNSLGNNSAEFASVGNEPVPAKGKNIVAVITWEQRFAFLLSWKIRRTQGPIKVRIPEHGCRQICI